MLRGTLLVIAVVTIGACGASEKRPDLRSSVEAYSAAYLSGDGATAYQLLTTRCRASTQLSELAAMTETAQRMNGNVQIETFSAAEDGDHATATYTFAVPALNQTDEPWLRESGAWHNNDC